LGQSAQTKVKLMKSKVLFVDDEQMILDVHRRQARSFREEWDTRFALSGEIALKLLSEEPADVVVSDLQMPGIGFGISRQDQKAISQHAMHYFDRHSRHANCNRYD